MLLKEDTRLNIRLPKELLAFLVDDDDVADVGLSEKKVCHVWPSRITEDPMMPIHWFSRSGPLLNSLGDGPDLTFHFSLVQSH